MVVVVSIILVLTVMMIPVYTKGSKMIQLVNCVNLRKKLYACASQYLNEAAGNNSTAARSPLNADMQWWKDTLESYGSTESMWYCPSSEDHSTNSVSDFMYVGASPYDFKYAEDKSELYLFVEKYSNHGEDLYLTVKADGSVGLENFLK